MAQVKRAAFSYFLNSQTPAYPHISILRQRHNPSSKFSSKGKESWFPHFDSCCFSFDFSDFRPSCVLLGQDSLILLKFASRRSLTRGLHVILWLSFSEVRGGYGWRSQFQLSGFHKRFTVIWLHISALCSGLNHCKQYPYWEWNLSNRKEGDGCERIPLVVFISCTLAAMHAGRCWLSLADHSSTERVNRCSLAFPNRGDLTRSNLATSLGSCWWSRRKRRGRRKRGGHAVRKTQRWRERRRGRL